MNQFIDLNPTSSITYSNDFVEINDQFEICTFDNNEDAPNQAETKLDMSMLASSYLFYNLQFYKKMHNFLYNLICFYFFIIFFCIFVA